MGDPTPFSAACHGRDLRANVRARLYWLRKRGHQVERMAGRITAMRAAPVTRQTQPLKSGATQRWVMIFRMGICQ